MKINTFAKLIAELERTDSARKRGVQKFRIVLEAEYIPVIISQMKEAARMLEANSLITDQRKEVQPHT